MNQKSRLMLLALCLLLLGYAVLEHTKVMTLDEDYLLKQEASMRTQTCLEAVKAHQLARGLVINPINDSNHTGLIGLDYSPITTTLGNLEAKRTSINPNMAATVVDMFRELGLVPGDTVAVNYSGSFPALNIATLCAIEVMGLKPIIISSFGSSTHGANDPDFTFLDMEHLLYEQGLISYQSRYFSIGGMLDVGKEMDPAVKDTVIRRLEGYGYPFFYQEDLLENINSRYQLYRAEQDIKCFINVGGNDASFGDSTVMVYVDCGILTQLPNNDKSTGLVQLFIRDNVPVIHLLNIKSLATKYGLPIDPQPLPPVGEGGVYSTYEYHRPLAALLLLAAALILFLVYRADKRPQQAAGN